MRHIWKRIKDIWLGKTGPQRRLKGWLWQRRTPRRPSSGDPLVLFAIPLIGRHRATDWARVCANLAETLAALQRQSDGQWRALICGQDRPDLPPALAGDPRIAFVPYRGRDKFYDKGDKRIALIRHIGQTVRGDGYYMQLDADDILHPALVAHVRGADNGAGHVITRGYVADLDGGRMAPLGPEPGRAPFNLMCGSCNIVRYDLRQGRAWLRVLRVLRAHGTVPATLADYGLHLEPVPFPAALYLVGHGENMVRRRGTEGGKFDYLDRHGLPADQQARIRAEFGVSSA